MKLFSRALRTFIKRLRFIKREKSATRLLLYTFFLLTCIRLGLRFLPFATVQQKVDRLSQSVSKTSPEYTLYGIVWAVNGATRHMPGGAKCLARALTTQILMGQQQYPCDLCIGVSKGDKGELKAHAWVESDQQIIVGWLPDLSQYKRLEKSFFKGFVGLT